MRQPAVRRVGRAAMVLLALSVAGLATAACAPVTTDDESDDGFDIEYCEENERGELQEDRCSDDPSRYRDGSYVGVPGGGGGSGGGDGDRNGATDRTTPR